MKKRLFVIVLCIMVGLLGIRYIPFIDDEVETWKVEKKIVGEWVVI